jgi:hypothetical protein
LVELLHLTRAGDGHRLLAAARAFTGRGHPHDTLASLAETVACADAVAPTDDPHILH